MPNVSFGIADIELSSSDEMISLQLHILGRFVEHFILPQ
jgi:hypothetical protein